MKSLHAEQVQKAPILVGCRLVLGVDKVKGSLFRILANAITIGRILLGIDAEVFRDDVDVVDHGWAQGGSEDGADDAAEQIGNGESEDQLLSGSQVLAQGARGIGEDGHRDGGIVGRDNRALDDPIGGWDSKGCRSKSEGGSDGELHLGLSEKVGLTFIGRSLC